MFYSCRGLTNLDLSSFNTSSVMDMSRMFLNCIGLTTLNFGDNFDTSSVMIMSYMFYNCSKLTLDCSSWNVDKVTSYSGFNTNASGVIAPTWVN